MLKQAGQRVSLFSLTRGGTLRQPKQLMANGLKRDPLFGHGALQVFFTSRSNAPQQ